MSKVFLTIFILICAISIGSTQTIDTDQILRQNADKIEQKRKEAAAKGISEAELQARLKEKGYDMTNLQPSQLTSLEGATDEAIRELEMEKLAEQNKIKLDKNKSAKKEEILSQDKTILEKKEEVKAKRTRGLDDFDFTPEEPGTQGLSDANQIDIQEQAAITTDSLKEPGMDQVQIYGQHLFINSNAKAYTNSNDLVPSNDYLLGPGDQLRIVIFGKSIFDGSFEIDEDGYIDPKTFPKIYLKGVEFGKSKELISSRFKQRYSFGPGQIEVSLKRARTITVGVYGEVKNPGTYTYPAANSAFNLIVIAKGLTNIGSVRNIQIVTPGKGVRRYDLYQAMLNPLKSANIYLQMNDFIQVPVAQKVVQISGAVNRPFKYELLPKETIGELISYAGGLAPNADKEIIQIVRYENGARKILEINFDQAKTTVPVNGDQITILQYSKEIKNLVSIFGEVERPGAFSWEEGLTVADALKRAVLKRTTKMDIAFIERTNDDNSISLKTFSPREVLANAGNAENYTLKPLDKIRILGNPDFTQYYKVNASGAVRNPGAFDYDPNQNLRVNDLLLLAGGIKPEAINRGYLIRTDSATLERQYMLINVLNAFNNPSSADNIVLKPLDRVLVLDNTLVVTESTVTVGGAVKNPGKFKFGQNMTLLDAVTLAGGLKMEAATNRVDVFRMIFQNNKPTKVVAATFDINRQLINADEALLQTPLQPFDVIEVRSVPNFEFQQMVTISGEVKYPGRYAITSPNMKISDLINVAGGVTDESFPGGSELLRTADNVGLIIIELNKILAQPNGPNDIVLRAEDMITVPKKQEIVSISGAVNLQDVYADDLLKSRDKISVAFQGKKSAKFYIQEYAGGFSEHADKNKVYVNLPSGRKVKTKHILGIRVYPKVEKGSLVSVGYEQPKPERTEPKEKANWSKVIADSVAQATAILTLVLLINTLNKS